MGYRTRVTYKVLCTSLGLTAPTLILDAGDSASWPDTGGTSWLDVSGNGYDFLRGTTSSAEGATDPTFFGTAGAKTKDDYWQNANTGYFVYDSANETWMTDIYKANAIFTLVAAIYLPPEFGVLKVGAQFGLCGCMASSLSDTGFGWTLESQAAVIGEKVSTHQLLIVGGTGADVFRLVDDGLVPGWNFLAFSMNQTTPLCTSMVNGKFRTSTSAYASPSAGAATNTFSVMSRGSAGANLCTGGNKLGMLMAWGSTALTQADLTALYNASQSTFTTRGAFP